MIICKLYSSPPGELSCWSETEIPTQAQLPGIVTKKYFGLTWLVWVSPLRSDMTSLALAFGYNRPISFTILYIQKRFQMRLSVLLLSTLFIDSLHAQPHLPLYTGLPPNSKYIPGLRDSSVYYMRGTDSMEFMLVVATPELSLVFAGQEKGYRHGSHYLSRRWVYGLVDAECRPANRPAFAGCWHCRICVEIPASKSISGE